MIKKLLLPTFLFLILLGCDSENEDSPNQVIEELDTTPPSITFQGIGEEVELRSTLQISVQDASNLVNTVVKINDEEVMTSSEKQFTYTLNPFDFPNGETTLTITATDEANNENVKTHVFELKKLLFQNLVGRSSESIDFYVALNLESTGELIAHKKMITDDDRIFYAPDGFEEQDIIATEYYIDKGGLEDLYHLAMSTGGVKPGTIRLTDQEVRNELGLEPSNNTKNDQFDVTVEGRSFPLLFSAIGSNYGMGNRSSSSYSSSYTLTLDYNQELTNDIFLYYLNQSNEKIFEDYRYLFIEDFTDRTLRFEELSTVSEDDIVTVGLPELVEKFTTWLLGYSSNENYRQGNFRLLFFYGRLTQESGFLFQYPNLSEYPVLERGLDLNLTDGRIVRYLTKDLTEVTIPPLSVQKVENSIATNGEYDFLELDLKITESLQGKDFIFKRTYKNRYRESIENPFDKLEIPTEIIEYLNAQGLSRNSIDNSGEMILSLTRYENQIDYPNGPFFTPTGREAGDRVSVSFPLER
ncbi:hypothetical protein FGF1_16050 [Flavobacteriaceae bacterium GF1]